MYARSLAPAHASASPFTIERTACGYFCGARVYEREREGTPEKDFSRTWSPSIESSLLILSKLLSNRRP